MKQYQEKGNWKKIKYRYCIKESTKMSDCFQQVKLVIPVKPLPGKTTKQKLNYLWFVKSLTL